MISYFENIKKEKMERLIDISRRLKSNYIEKECKKISERLLQGSFNIVFLGQFKRGKSSLINAFLGENILPTGIVPVTAIISVIKYSERRSCIVKRLDSTEEEIGIEDIYLYATQEENPDNRKGVDYLEIRLTNQYLKKGLFLIDTPGIGSVFESNTMVTKGFLQDIDTAVIVLGVDPPISYDEFAIIKDIGKKVKDIIFVINKVDRESNENIETIKKFTADLLKKELHYDNPSIYCVSAIEKIAGHTSYEWNLFQKKIDEMLINKAGIIASSYKNAIGRLFEELIKEIDRYISALKSPLEQMRNTVESLKLFKTESEIFIRELGYRFQSEQDRISQLIDIEQKKFLADKTDDINKEFEDLFETFLTNINYNREHYFSQMHKIAEKYVFMCIEQISPFSERLYKEFSQRYIKELREKVKRINDIIGEDDLSEFIDDIDIQMYNISGFYFHHFMRYTSSSPFKYIFNIFLPKKKKILLMKDELKDYLNWLIYANCSRYNGDVNQRIIESRRRIEADFKNMIDRLISRTDDVISYTEAIVKNGENRVNTEVENLFSLRGEALELRKDLFLDPET